MKRASVIVALVGLLLTVGGAVTLWGTQNAEAVLAADRAQIPDPLTFEAQDGRYRVMLLREPVVPNFGNMEAQLLCEIARADGTSETIDTAMLATRAETDLGIELASFDAVAGPTTVTCDFPRGSEHALHFYSVARTSKHLNLTATAALGLGILILTCGAVFYFRSRMQALTARRPLSAEGEAAGPPSTP